MCIRDSDELMYKANVAVGWMSPLNHATYHMHNFGYDLLPRIWQTYLIFGLLIALCFFLSLRAVRKYNFNFTGTELSLIHICKDRAAYRQSDAKGRQDRTSGGKSHAESGTGGNQGGADGSSCSAGCGESRCCRGKGGGQGDYRPVSYTHLCWSPLFFQRVLRELCAALLPA